MKKALVVIDLQNDYFEGGKFPLWNSEQTLNEIKRVVSEATKMSMPVIYIQHVADPSIGEAPFFNEGTDGVKIHKELLEVAPSAIIVRKAYADGFYETILEETLNELEIEELLICGMMTQNCVTHTAISKSAEKYAVKVLQDCCTSMNEPIHFIALHAMSTRVNLVNSRDLI